MARIGDTELATQENFDEIGYVLANPDVASAVTSGEFTSGRHHFDLAGQSEGRAQMKAAFAGFTRYESRAPSAGNAFDLFEGRWSTSIPGHGYGQVALFEDSRITWFLKEMGSVAGKSIIELGPLEGGHTKMLADAGAEVTAIEANTGAYLRCLIAKEELGIGARFLLGDFETFIAETDQRFDAAIASGVLYHMTDPIKMLDDVSRISDTLLIWTHYFEDAPLRARGVRGKFVEAPETQQHCGVAVELWKQQYLQALEWTGFCGGSAHNSLWLTKEGLFGILERNGYKLTINFEDTEHQNGPSIAILARRSKR